MTKKKESKGKKAKRKIVIAVGRRKTAVARAKIEPGRGIVRINKKLLDIYEPELLRMKIMEPLILAGEIAKQVNITVNVRGGGIVGQADAARTAIARALVEYTGSEALKKLFKEYDRTLLAGDSRQVEPKKQGGPKARARFQTSYR